MLKLLVILGLVVVVSTSQENSVLCQCKLSQCAASDHCPADRACIEQKCEDPCVGLCGNNTSCAVRFHIPSCACLPGYTGNPFVACIPQEPRECPRSQPTSGRKKFILEPSMNVNWYTAFVHCASRGGRLATVESKEDNDMIKEEIRKSESPRGDFWTSATCLSEGKWIWMTTGKPLSGFSDWWRGEPNNVYNNEHCLMFAWDFVDNSGQRWFDTNCLLNKHPVCEFVE